MHSLYILGTFQFDVISITILLFNNVGGWYQNHLADIIHIKDIMRLNNNQMLYIMTFRSIVLIVATIILYNFTCFSRYIYLMLNYQKIYH